LRLTGDHWSSVGSYFLIVERAGGEVTLNTLLGDKTQGIAGWYYPPLHHKSENNSVFFRLSTFDFRLSTFDFRLSTVDFRLSTFEFRMYHGTN
jgi:hypothetical protein